jgi:hypothetical protein
VVKDFKITHQGTNITECVNWVKKNIEPGSNIAVLEAVDYFFVPSEATLGRWLNSLNNSYDNMDIRLNKLFTLAKTEYHNLDRENPLVGKLFGALEQQRVFVYKQLLWYFKNVEKPSPNYNLFLYTNGDYQLNIISSRKEEMLDLFLKHQVDLFIGNEFLSVLSPYLVQSFIRHPGDGYYIYLNNKK